MFRKIGVRKLSTDTEVASRAGISRLSEALTDDHSFVSNFHLLNVPEAEKPVKFWLRYFISGKKLHTGVSVSG